MAESSSKDGPLTGKSAKESAVFLLGSLSEHHPPTLLPVKLHVLRKGIFHVQSNMGVRICAKTLMLVFNHPVSVRLVNYSRFCERLGSKP